MDTVLQIPHRKQINTPRLPFWHMEAICPSLSCQVSLVVSQSVLAAAQAGVLQDVIHLLSRACITKLGCTSVW